MPAPTVSPRAADRRDQPPRAQPPRARSPGGWRRPAWLSGGGRGSVALEFALTAPLLLVLMGAGVDLGMLLRVQIVMASGLMNTVQYANVQGVATTNAHLLSVMQNATALTGMTASVAGPSCYCPSTYPVRLTAATCGSTCATGGTPGSYVVITASYPYVPMMPGLSHVVATNVVQSATAMLQ